MQQFKLFRVLMSPSPFSLVATPIVSAAYIAYIGWSHLSDNPVIYDFVQGPYGASMYIWQGTEPVAVWFTKFFSSDAGYYVLLAAVVLTVSIATFTMVQLLSLIFLGTARFVRTAEYSNQSMLLEMFIQLWLRCLALIGLVFFIAVTLSSLLPTVHLFVNTGASYLRAFDLRGIMPVVLALLMCTATLHMNLVFIRLLLLRPRIFSSGGGY